METISSKNCYLTAVSSKDSVSSNWSRKTSSRSAAISRVLTPSKQSLTISPLRQRKISSNKPYRAMYSSYQSMSRARMWSEKFFNAGALTKTISLSFSRRSTTIWTSFVKISKACASSRSSLPRRLGMSTKSAWFSKFQRILRIWLNLSQILMVTMPWARLSRSGSQR